MKIFVRSERTFDTTINVMNEMLDQSSRDDTDYGPFQPSDWIQGPPSNGLCQFSIRQIRDELRRRETMSTAFYNTDDENDRFCRETNATINKNIANGSFQFDAQNNILRNLTYYVAAFII